MMKDITIALDEDAISLVLAALEEKLTRLGPDLVAIKDKTVFSFAELTQDRLQQIIDVIETEIEMQLK